MDQLHFRMLEAGKGRIYVEQIEQELRKNDYDVMVVGSGVAGLYAALNFSPDVRVLVLSKRELTLCNSFLAQGGVAAVVDKENDDYKLHIADTLIAGGYKNDLRSLEILVNEGPEDLVFFAVVPKQ